MYAAFVILITTFFALNNTQVVTCVDSNSFRGAQSIIAIVYKIFFLVISIALIFGFCVYGTRIIFELKKTSGTGPTKLTRFVRLGAVTVICSMCLLAQAINMIVGSYDSSRPLTFLLIFVLVTEIVPCIIFITLWSKGSIFSRAMDIFTQAKVSPKLTETSSQTPSRSPKPSEISSQTPPRSPKLTEISSQTPPRSPKLTKISPQTPPRSPNKSEPEILTHHSQSLLEQNGSKDLSDSSSTVSLGSLPEGNSLDDSETISLSEL